MIELKYTGQEDALEESVLTLLQDYDMAVSYTHLTLPTT